MADIATFGIKISAPEGVEKTEAAFKRIDAAADKSTQAVNRHAGAFDAMAKKTASANNMSASVAAQLQAAGVRYDATARSFHSTAQNAVAAHNKIAAATAITTNATNKAAGGFQVLDRMVLSGSGRLGMFAGSARALVSPIGAVVAILAVLTLGVYAAKQAWDFFIASLAAAGKVQSSQTSLKLMIGNAKEAEKVFKQLNQLELDTGIFDETALNKAATQLWAVGIGLDDLVPRIKELGNVAAVMNQPIEGTVSSYVRLISMLGATGKIQSRTLMQFAQQGFDVLAVLRQATGKSESEVRKMVEDHKIGIEQINAALSEFAKKDFMGARARDWENLWKRLKAGWQELHEVFGKPVIDALSPIFERMLDKTGPLIQAAGHFGEMMGRTIRDLDKAAQESKFAEVLVDKFSKAMAKFAPIAAATVVKLVGEFAKFTFKFHVELVKVGWNDLKNLMGQQMYGGATAKPEMQYRPTTGFTELPANNYGDVRRKSILPSGGTDSEIEKYKSDLKIINDYGKEYALIQATAASATEKTRRIIELEVKTAKELADPEAYINSFRTIQGAWELMENARLKKAEEIDAKIKMGTASVAESMARGFDKAMESWGNFETKVSKFAEDALNRIGDGFADAFGDLITGTKNAGDAFRDMAVSILEDISRMIIKMLVLQAIQYAMGFFGNSTPGFTSTAQLGSVATGGPIIGPSHSGGGVPIEAEGGEFMLRREAVRNQRMEDLYALNAGQAYIQKFPFGGPIGRIGGARGVFHDYSYYGGNYGNPFGPRSPFSGGNTPYIPRSNYNPYGNRGGVTVFGGGGRSTPFGGSGTPFGTGYGGRGGPQGSIYGLNSRTGNYIYNALGYDRYTGMQNAGGALLWDDDLDLFGGGGLVPRMHSGGIVGFEGQVQRMAAGGEVQMVAQRGEGVFTRGQMAAIGAGISGGNQVTVIVNVDSHDNVTSSTSKTAGRDAEEWKQVGELVQRVVTSRLEREKRHGGQLHVSQTGARS